MTRSRICCGRRAREGLGAVAALQQEGVAGGGAGEPLAQDVDLTGEDEGRQARDLLRRRADGVEVGPHRLLLDRQRAPIVETGDHLGIGDDNGL